MKEKCPDCGADVKYYHDLDFTRVVCSKRCKGYKVIEKITRKKVISFMCEEYELEEVE